jgi:hypothetical protein
MSRIYFHSPSDEAELRGSERAWMGVFCNDLMVAALGGMRYRNSEWLKELLPADCYVRRSPDFEESLRLFMTSFEGKLIVEGEEIDTFTLALNTAWVVGNDPVRLMARLHGQCEVHCWVAGNNRNWLAQIMKAGLASGLYRKQQGWEAVIDFLSSRADEPVVCSYSVCESFPNFGCLPENHPLRTTDDEAFYELPDDERWALCFKGLQEHGSGLELDPHKWDKFFFNRGHNVFTLPRN